MSSAGKPALAHALRIAGVIRTYVPDPAPEIVAAALVHDSPELAPADLDLDAALAWLLSVEVARIVRALHDEHDALDASLLDVIAQDIPVAVTSAADKIVSIRAVLDRSTGADPSAYWSQRHGFVSALGYFRACATATLDGLPAAMAIELDKLVTRAERQADGRG